jgi:chromosome condensin MukBEF ATPase and DNA-binding subunit MukB
MTTSATDELRAEIATLKMCCTEAEEEVVALRTERDRLQAALQAIADQQHLNGIAFKKRHPALNRLLDQSPTRFWHAVLSDYALAALKGGN